MIELTLAQARRFLLAKNGLIGGHRFRGKKGARDTPALRRGIEEAAQRLCAMNGLERVTWAE